MFGTSMSPLDLVPLTPGTVELESGQATFLLDHSGEFEDEYQNPPNQQCFVRSSCWTLCSATAIYTTKRLMITHGYHYPLTIALHSFLAILVTYSIGLYFGSNSSNAKGAKWGLQQSRPDALWPNYTWLVMIPAALAAGASLPMFLEGVLHMPSLAVLVMLFPVSYAAEAVILFICCSPSRSKKWIPWEVLVIVGASSAVLYNEYRLMVPGLIWGVTGVIFMGVARALFTIGCERCGSELDFQPRLNAYHGFIVMSLVFGLIISFVCGWLVEQVAESYFFPLATWGLMVINIASIVGTAFSGTTLLAYSPISSANKFSTMPLSITDYLASFVSSIIVLMVAIHSRPITVVSWVQIAAYIISSTFLLGASQTHTLVLNAMDSSHQQLLIFLGISSNESRKPGRFITSSALFLLVLFFSWTISTLSSLSVNSIPPSIPSILDTHYSPSSRFEIVVSMYKESPSSVKRMLDSIRTTQLISTLTPNITIYTKDPAADLDALLYSTGATRVERLPNLGREGATYLYHMVHNWDTLAEQTMFIQAHAHNMRELLPRINSYLVPQTGMLSLGFTGVLCACETCGDRWGWEDGFNIIPSLYSKIYHQACDSTTPPILLSYKGQFVASAPRIRGVDKRVFEGLLRAITGSEGWSHAPDVVRGREDVVDNPFFGYTLERIWGLLMQCAGDGIVAAKCPSLLSGMGRGGEVGDCQCLDRGLE